MTIKKISIAYYFPMLLQATFWAVLKVSLPVLPWLSTIFNTKSSNLQWIMSFAFASSGVAGLLWGPIIDSFKARTFLLIFTIVSIVLLSSVAFSPNVFIFGLLYILSCCVVNGLLVCGRILPVIYINDSVLVKKSLSLYLIGGYSACIFAPFIGGWVEHLFSWREVFFIVPLWLIFILFVTLKLEATPKISSNNDKNILNNAKGFYTHLKNKSFMLNLLIVYCFVTIVQSYYISLPFWIAPVYHILPKDIPYYLFPMFLPGIFGSFLYNLSKKYFSEKKVFQIGLYTFLLAGIIPIIISFVDMSELSGIYVIPGVLLTIGQVIIFPIVSYNAFKTITNFHNSASSLYSMVVYVSGGIGIYITSFIHLSNFYFEGFFILIMTLLIFLIYPKTMAMSQNSI